MKFLIKRSQRESFDFSFSVLGEEVLVELDQSSVFLESNLFWSRFSVDQILFSENLTSGGECQSLSNRFFEGRVDFIGQTTISRNNGCRIG